MEWVKIDEDNEATLPVEGIEVLIYSEEGYMSVEKRSANVNHIYADTTDGGYATHWMHLPPPPKR